MQRTTGFNACHVCRADASCDMDEAARTRSRCSHGRGWLGTTTGHTKRESFTSQAKPRATRTVAREEARRLKSQTPSLNPGRHGPVCELPDIAPGTSFMQARLCFRVIDTNVQEESQPSRCASTERASEASAACGSCDSGEPSTSSLAVRSSTRSC